MTQFLGDAGAEGVGVSYHPFLHDTLLNNLDLFDFVELPLDLYADTARAALLDPGHDRLREIVAAKPCVWDGSVLSLGSAGPSADPSFAAPLLTRLGGLCAEAKACRITEVIGFRRLVCADGVERDLGRPHEMPFGEAAARWIVARQAAAEAALGTTVLLRLPAAPVRAPHTGHDAPEFLHRVSALGPCRFVVDTQDLVRLATHAGVDPLDIVPRLPGARVAVVSTDGRTEADWAALSALAALPGVRSVVLRRDRNPFPIDTVASDLRRARAELARTSRAVPGSPDVSAALADTGGLPALQAYQAEFVGYFAGEAQGPAPVALEHIAPGARDRLVGTVQAWHNWRQQAEEAYKARQIMALMVRGVDHDRTGRR